MVFVVSARRLRRQKEWEVELDRRLDGVGFLRVADVPAEGCRRRRLRRVASTLRKRVPQPVRVLVDTERHWALGLGLDTREVNALAFDAHGREVARVRGARAPNTVGALENPRCSRCPACDARQRPQGVRPEHGRDHAARCDVLLVGGGLANGLIAWRLRQRRPDVSCSWSSGSRRSAAGTPGRSTRRTWSRRRTPGWRRW